MNILHLSDFHICEQNRESLEKLGRRIDHAISGKGEDFKPQIILVTGDLTETGSSDEFEYFKDGFSNILKNSSLSEVKHIMFLPGNHDYSWTLTKTRKCLFNNFREKMQRGLTNVPDDLDDVAKEDIKKYELQHIFVKEAERSLLLIGMNSMEIDSPEWPGIGYFEEDQLSAVVKLISYYRKQDAAARVIVAFHHHLVPVSVLERGTLENPKKFSITLDARRAINWFLKGKVEFAVHGHQHQPSAITWSDEEREDGRQLHIISAGCLAGKNSTGESGRNSFMLYSVYDDKVIVNWAESSSQDADVFIWKNEIEYVSAYNKHEEKNAFRTSQDTADHHILDEKVVFEGNLQLVEKSHETCEMINRERIISFAEQEDRWINRANDMGELTIKGLVEKLVGSIREDGSVAYELGKDGRYRTSTLATVMECMYDINLLPKADLEIMQRKLLSLRDNFQPFDVTMDDVIEKDDGDLPAWGIDEAPSVWTTSKALIALFNTKYQPETEQEKIKISDSVVWLANQAYNNSGWGYQKEENNEACKASVPMTALAMQALSLALMDKYIGVYLDCNGKSDIIKESLTTGIRYLYDVKVELRQGTSCYWTYQNKPNLSASIWALEAWRLASPFITEKKVFYQKVYTQIKGKVQTYVIEHLPVKEDDEGWTECFFFASKYCGLKYKPAILKEDKAFYSFTPYLISYFIKDNKDYLMNEKVLAVIRWVLNHRDDTWLIQKNYNSTNACTISAAMAINVIVNWVKRMVNCYLEDVIQKMLFGSYDV